MPLQDKRTKQTSGLEELQDYGNLVYFVRLQNSL